MLKDKKLELPTGGIYLMTNIVRHRERCLDNKLTLIGLTLPEWRVLRIIHSFNDAIPMSVLIEHSQTDRTALGRTVERLVARGWVEKLPHANDKRAFLVKRLDAMEDTFKKAYDLVAEYDNNLLVNLTDEEHAVFINTLIQIEKLTT
ncbi:MarR family winged helix-turn-helix transcriptional regulator [Rouxiella sp. Mn2063]|uniref:MarR family winged helix-turn-helix transcriptional regulator n=1 Tax=Rouxiella sp. Mn2063 TaxID=3395262 RepID=UPI003BCCFCB4